MKHLEVIEVRWVDSSAGIGWSSIDEIGEDSLVVSVGIIAFESSSFLTLALSYDEDSDEWNPVLSIPQVAIKSRKKLCRIKTKKMTTKT